MGKGVSIYLVDDDAVVRHATLSQLASSGYSARAFDSAEAFLASVDLTRAGVLLLDQHQTTEALPLLQSAVEKKPIFHMTRRLSCADSASALRHISTSFCIFTSSGVQLLATPFL